RKIAARRLEALPHKSRTLPSSEDPPDAAEKASVLGHHLIELAEVQPHPLAARALVQLDAPIGDGHQLAGALRAPSPGNGENAPAFFFGRLGFPLLEDFPPSLELESREVLLFLLCRLHLHHGSRIGGAPGRLAAAGGLHPSPGFGVPIPTPSSAKPFNSTLGCLIPSATP